MEAAARALQAGGARCAASCSRFGETIVLMERRAESERGRFCTSRKVATSKGAREMRLRP
eukprot:800101-Pleurochrysis_carterae.AAC.1